MRKRGMLDEKEDDDVYALKSKLTARLHKDEIPE